MKYYPKEIYMLNDVYSGYWTGDISGTNQGGISFTLNVEGNKVSGSAKIHELGKVRTSS